MNIKVFTHSDLDGAACGVILKKFRPDDNVDVRFCNYDNIDRMITRFLEEDLEIVDKIMITDITPSREVCQTLDNLPDVGKLCLLDHHKTKQWVQNYSWAVFNNRLCGAELTYGVVGGHEPRADEFVQAVSAWDLWKTDDPLRERGERLNTLIKFMGLFQFLDEFKDNLDLDMTDTFTKIWRYININKKRYITQTVSRQLSFAPRFMDGYGNMFKIIFANDYISEIGHTILGHEDEEDLAYVLLLDPTNNHCGLRSKDNIDVSEIAKQLKGGGHKNAAGFVYDFRKKITNSMSNLLNKLEPNG